MILKQFHIYENSTSDTEDKTEWFKKVQAMRKEIEKLRSFKPREQIISDIICKITNNDIKFNENSNLFAFNNKIYDISNCKFVEPSPEQYINISTGYNFDVVENTNLKIYYHNK